jgi:hypothetical protein
MVNWWRSPEGVCVLPDGGWRVGGSAILHTPSLRYLKARLVFEKQGAFLVEGARRIPVLVQGPPFEVTSLVLDHASGEARAVLDDHSEEHVHSDSLSMDEATGRFECLVRGGRARAILSRGAHQTLLEHIEEEAGRFFLRVGARRIPVRT